MSGSIGASGGNSDEQLRWVYGELLRIEAHWTGQVRDQQARLATLLAANGFLLGLLGSGVIVAPSKSLQGGGHTAYLVSLALLTLAVVVGVVALLPRQFLKVLPWAWSPNAVDAYKPGDVLKRDLEPYQETSKPRGAEEDDSRTWRGSRRVDPQRYWLDSRALWDDFSRTTGKDKEQLEGWLAAATYSLAMNQRGNLDHLDILRVRGTLMNAQLGLLGVGALVFLRVVVAQV